MRKRAGLAVLVMVLVSVPAVQAQSGGQPASSFITGVSPANLTFTPVNPTRGIHTPTSLSGTSSFSGFNPVGFFHRAGNAFQWPPRRGVSLFPGSIVAPNNPFPTEIFTWKAGTTPTSSQLPTMKVQTSFHR